MIDEKKLIEDIHEYFKRHIDNIYCKDADGATTVILNFNADIHRIVENQPKVGEWILCSERLPGKYELCLITQKIGTQKVRKVALRLLGEWKINGRKIKDEAVIAWMPLPEPYREEKKNE